jgi:hypothetical protein
VSEDSHYLSDEEATRLWKRAAQLQADAARQAETDAAQEAADQLDVATDSGAEGYALTHVRSAAIEAGINAAFVDSALGDLLAERAMSGRGRGPGSRLARRLLGNPSDALTARRVLKVDVRQVLAAMEEVLPSAPYNLVLRDQQGDPLVGGMLIFDIPGASFAGAGTPGFAGDASWADFRQVYVSCRSIADEPASCEVTVRAPIAWAFRVNGGLCSLFVVMGGGAGLGLGSAGAAGVAGLAAALGLAGPALGVLAALVVTGGAVGGGLATRTLYRTVFRYALRKGQTALEGLLSSISTKAQGGWGVLPPAPHPPATQLSPDSVDAG